MNYIVRTKTPLFTGDVERKTTAIRETGIIGSMRWWYEALVRGNGGHACDPTLKDKCEGCDACNVFGSTNAARTFYLRFDEKSAKSTGTKQIKVEIDDGARWYLPAGKMGEFNLSIVGLRGKKKIVESYIPVLLKLMANWGGIGAKNYIGYGVFELLDEQCTAVKIDDLAVGKLLGSISSGKPGTLKVPSLKKMFFCKVTFDFSSGLPDTALGIADRDFQRCKSQKFLPYAAHFRRQLRALFRASSDTSGYPSVLPCLSRFEDSKLWSLRHETIGEARGQSRQGSKIAVSHIYPVDEEKFLWEMRIWGYIPDQQIPAGVDDTIIIADLKERFADEAFWRYCLGNRLITKHSVRFRYVKNRDDYEEYKTFVTDLVLNL